MTDREKHLDWLCRLKSNLKVFIPKDFHLDEFEQSLDYAISSINTDLKYDLIYEGEEVYTKADMVVMLTDIQLEIEETVKEEELIDKEWANGLHYSEKIIQQKIDALGDIK